MAKSKKITVNHSEIKIIYQDEKDFISLTDMTTSFKEGSGLIGKWITNKNTLEYLGIWEKINNQDFNYPEFEVIKNEAGTKRFIISDGQWISAFQCNKEDLADAIADGKVFIDGWTASINASLQHYKEEVEIVF